MVKATPFSSVLVANRGEIACRIMRTAKAMGLETIAVYAEADAAAPHVKMADQAFLLGPSPVSESYLRVDRIKAAIAATGAEAIHPGYGFLSENADFARACNEQGIVFIGPDPHAIELMGDKAQAKQRMIEADVPCVPGYQGADQSNDTLIAEGQKIGFPIMVKAAAGGGGRGMRLVTEDRALPNAIAAARSEAENAFGSSELILERAIREARHVEIQVFADRHGNVIHLGERDCSVQRRHQKVLEEAPCPVMTPSLREAMGAAAVKAARDIKYVGAGTVEFLLDSSGEFFFLEMNTRLQVEHPVTEMVTGLDLVEMQIRVAQGGELGLTQDDVELKGHAIEARLYAEDTAADFLPATGPVDLWHPAQGRGIRIDSGIVSGAEVSPFYDPMVAKIIAHGSTREEARLRLVGALKETALFGVRSNKNFLIKALERQAFVDGAATTAFITDNFSENDLVAPPVSLKDAGIAAILQYAKARAASLSDSVAMVPALLNWASASDICTPYSYVSDNQLDLTVTPESADSYKVATADEMLDVTVLSISSHVAVFEIEGERINVIHNIPTSASDGTIQISVDGRDLTLTNLNAVIAAVNETAGAGAVVAPMHGALLEVFVEKGQPVTKGDRLAVLEAMKMQHEILADVDGVVTDVHFDAGVQVAAGSLLIEIETD